ncbi:MAG: hypothetical protein ACREE6_06005 [Limisphaerales bacterium]
MTHLLVFDLFARMITSLPAGVILKALDLEAKMLERDSENHRLYLPADAYSIFCFRQFVRVVKFGGTIPNCKPLLPAHLNFYKKTVARLIEAKELPESATKAFDDAFVSI